MSSKPTDETRRIVQRRDRYRCAMCDRETGSHWSGDSIHHREPRSHPFDRLHQPENLLQLCGSGTTGCHGWVHAHPARAYRLGYLVHTVGVEARTWAKLKQGYPDLALVLIDELIKRERDKQ